MKRFVIERTIPSAAELSPTEMREIAKTSNGVIRELGPGIQWEHSYVLANHIYCVYLAESEEIIREHARRGKFPCDTVSVVTQVIGPLTAYA